MPLPRGVITSQDGPVPNSRCPQPATGLSHAAFFTLSCPGTPFNHEVMLWKLLVLPAMEAALFKVTVVLYVAESHWLVTYPHLAGPSCIF